MPLPAFFLKEAILMKAGKSYFSYQAREIYCFADTLALCDKLLDGGAKIIQLRNKHLDDRSFYALAGTMLSHVRRHDNAILIVNDRVDIALEIDADGIHIGQGDENHHEVIRRLPDDMIIGISVSSVREALDAEHAGATYIGAGAVFSTSTKPDAEIIGLEGVSNIVSAVNIPVVALGGISLDNIRQVVQTGARYYGIISQINEAEDISARLNEFFTVIKEGI
jgi:thiamine-phosphate diphosphorylase